MPTTVRVSGKNGAVTQPDAFELAYRIRRVIIEQSRRANVGHIGSSLSIADIVAALFGGALRSPKGATRPRPLRALEGPRSTRAVRRRSTATGRLTDEQLSTLLRRGTAARRASGARSRRHRLLHRLARPGPLDRRRRRAGRRVCRARRARLRPGERRRMQRGLDLGGRHVRRPPPAFESRRDRRPQRPAGARLHPRRAGSRSARRPLATPSAGTCTRSTATTSRRLAATID